MYICVYIYIYTTVYELVASGTGKCDGDGACREPQRDGRATSVNGK